MSVKLNDASNLSVLTPNCPLDLFVPELKNSWRLQGTFKLALRRPHRVPESSRMFVQGDPVNLIDWKAYARNDQLIVREKRDEASSRVRIGIDISETMHFPNTQSRIVGKVSVPLKYEIAARIAFNLAYVHSRLGDSVEMWLTSPDGRNNTVFCYSPRNSSDILGYFDFLYQKQFKIDEFYNSFITKKFERENFDVSYWVGDCLGTSDYNLFLRSGRIIRLIHILSSLEVDLSWVKKEQCYYDEFAEKKEYLGKYLLDQKNYSRSLNQWIEKLSNSFSAKNRAYFLATDKTPISEYLNFIYSNNQTVVKNRGK
ncbi:MAG: DUF58 domain-containing protein [Bdellovibrionota bacterium]